MADILLICGYRGTGKDTLYKQLGSKEFNWVIYAPNKDIKFNNKDYQRMASASYLKYEIWQLLVTDQFKDYTRFEQIIDIYKDQPLVEFKGVYNPQSITTEDETKTLRRLLIDYAMAKRQEDPIYWIKNGMHNLISKYGPNTDIAVTDWRFNNEYQYCKDNLSNSHQITTVRVFRKDVPIPDANEISEHELDHYPTDFLLVSITNPESDFAAAVKLWPQYRDYVQIN